MSLRDQLVAKGLVSKKQARRADQQDRKKRKKDQGHRKRRAVLEAEAAAARQKAQDEAQRQRMELRRRREAERQAREERHRIRQILRSNQIRSRGDFRFHHPTLDGRTLHFVQVSERVAWKLRAGECAIAALREKDGPTEYAVISARAAERLQAIGEDLVVFWNRDTHGLSDPAECLWRPDWDISLQPRRASREDLVRPPKPKQQ